MNRVILVRQLFIFSACLISTCSFAQKWSTNLTPEELATEKKVLIEKYPDIFSVENILAIHKLKRDLSRVDYTLNGAYFEAFINSGRKDMLLIETDEQIAAETAPAIIKAHALTGKHTGWTIDKIYKVSTPSGGNLYRVDVYNGDKNKMDRLYLDNKGEPHRAPAK